MSLASCFICCSCCILRCQAFCATPELFLSQRPRAGFGFTPLCMDPHPHNTHFPGDSSVQALGSCPRPAGTGLLLAPENQSPSIDCLPLYGEENQFVTIRPSIPEKSFVLRVTRTVRLLACGSSQISLIGGYPQGGGGRSLIGVSTPQQMGAMRLPGQSFAPRRLRCCLVCSCSVESHSVILCHYQQLFCFPRCACAHGDSAAEVPDGVGWLEARVGKRQGQH